MIRVRLVTFWAFALITLARPAFAQTAIVVNGIQSPNVVVTEAGAVATVVVTNGPGNTTDWIGLFPIGAADTAFLYWKYLNGSTGAPSTGLTSATIQQLLPVAPGDYELRLFASNGYQRLATSPTIAVAPSSTALSINGVAPPGQATLTAGTSVSVGITNAPGNQADWVALYAVGAADTAFLDWRYLSGSTVPPSSGLTSATVTFQAPATAGVFEIRYFTNNTYQRLVSAAFIVQAASTQISVNGSVPPATVNASAGTAASLTVGNGPGNATDWVGLYAVGAGNGQFLSWQYLNGATTAPSTGLTNANLTFLLPATAGNYEFRFFTSNSNQLLVTSSTVAIASSAAEISLNGHAFPNAISAPAGSVTTASIAGGPGNATDWVGLYALGAGDSAFLDWRYLNGTTAPPTTGATTGAASFTTPVSAGDYEVRLFAANTYQRIVSSATISVPAPTAQISVNGTLPPGVVSALSGSTVSVAVTGGPGNASDWVALAAVGSGTDTYVAWQYLNGLLTPPAEGLTSATLSFPVPLAAGEYEFRLLVNGGFQRLASSTKVVSALPAVEVSLVSPTEGATLAGSPITLEASASTNSGAIANVSFYADGGLIESDTVAPFTASWTPSPGSHVLTATAANTTGQTATSLPVHITVSGSSPVTSISLVAPANGASFALPATVDLEAIVTSTVANTVTFYHGTTAIGTVAQAPYRVSWTAPGPGAYTFTATATDPFSNVITAAPATIAVHTPGSQPPAISATYFPSPNTDGWNHSAVTVTFSCASASSAIQDCPAPLTFSGQGANQTATVTATDAVGNATALVVSVNIDLTPPVVDIVSPSTPASTEGTSIAVAFAATDALSDIASVTCNRVQANLSAGGGTCVVPVSRGLNTVIVQAKDRAGNSRSQRVSVTANGTPSAYVVLPSTYSMAVGETKQMRVKDDFGSPSSTVVWEINNEAVGSIGNDGVLTALSPGSAIVTAHVGTASATSRVTIYPTGPLPLGTQRWSVEPYPQYSTLAALPTGGNGISTHVTLEVLWPDEAPYYLHTRIRGFDTDGGDTFSMTAPLAYGERVQSAIGVGEGLLLVTYDDTLPSSGSRPLSLVRVSGSPDWPAWRHELGVDKTSVAVAHDGTVFFHDLQSIVALDGVTGDVKFTVTPPPSRWRTIAPACPSHETEYVTDTRIGNIAVDADGAAVVVVIHHNTIETQYFSCTFFPTSRSTDSEVNLYRISTDGVIGVTNLKSYTDKDLIPEPGPALPDDLGGALGRWEVSCTIYASYNCGSWARHAIGGDLGGEYVFPRNYIGAVSGADQRGFVASDTLKAFDMRTGATLWSSPKTGFPTALAGGGVALNTSGNAWATTLFAPDGSIVAQNLGRSAQMANGVLGLVPGDVQTDLWTGPTGNGLGAIVAMEASSSPVGLASQVSGGGRNAAGRTYSTIDAAAIAALQEHNPVSIEANHEFGGSVCRQSTGRYFSTRPNINLQNTDNVIPSLCSSEAVQSGRYHTHGFDGNNTFSGPDVVKANNDSYGGVYRPHFVGTPCGEIHKLVGPDSVVLVNGVPVPTGHGIYFRLPERTSTIKVCTP